MNFVKAFEIILAHYEDIVAAVALAEKLFPAGSAGATKLAFVQSELQSNADLATKLGTGDFSALWPYVVKVINLIVKYAVHSAPVANAITTVVSTVGAVAAVGGIGGTGAPHVQA